MSRNLIYTLGQCNQNYSYEFYIWWNAYFQDPNEHAPEFKISGTDYTLRVKDNIVDREVL